MIAIYYGEEEYAIRKEVEKEAKKLVDISDSFSFIQMEYPKAQSYGILEEAQTISMFSDHKVIVVEQATFLSSDKSKDDGVEELIHFVSQKDPSVSYIFTVNSIDKRKKIVKELSKIANVKEFNKMDELGKNKYIANQLTKKDIQLSSNLIKMLENRLPSDMAIIQSELDKLALYGEGVDESVIDALIIRTEEDRIFDLMDAIIRKDKNTIITIYKDLKALRTEEIQLIALLSSQFRVLYQVKVCDSLGMYEAAIVSKLKAHPYQVKKSLMSSRSIATASLRSHLSSLATLDQNIKSGKVDKQVGFETYLLQSMQ